MAREPRVAEALPPGARRSGSQAACRSPRGVALLVAVSWWEAARAQNARSGAGGPISRSSRLYKTHGDSVCIPITAALLKTVEKLIVARQMIDKGDGKDILAARFEMHPFRVERYLIPLARKHEVPELREQMKRLCRLDVQVKGSAPSKRTLVELAALSIAA